MINLKKARMIWKNFRAKSECNQHFEPYYIDEDIFILKHKSHTVRPRLVKAKGKYTCPTKYYYFNMDFPFEIDELRKENAVCYFAETEKFDKKAKENLKYLFEFDINPRSKENKYQVIKLQSMGEMQYA